MRHFYKHLDLFDKVFIVFLIVIGVLSGIVGDWRGVIYMATFLLFVLILKSKDIVIEHQSDLIDRVLEVAESATNVLGGRKIVETKTIEFSVERKKSGNEKPSNEDKANAGRSRSKASKRKTSGANAEATRANGVPNRKPKATKKNR